MTLLSGLSNSFGITNFTGAGSYTLSVNGTFGNPNYVVTRNDGVWTVNRAQVVVTANGGSSVYGQSPVNPGLSASGLVNGESVAVLTGMSNSFGINSSTGAGRRTLSVVGTLSNGNYVVTSRLGGTWTVDRAPITVTADPQSRLLSETDPLLTYRITSGAALQHRSALRRPDPGIRQRARLLRDHAGHARGLGQLRADLRRIDVRDQASAVVHFAEPVRVGCAGRVRQPGPHLVPDQRHDVLRLIPVRSGRARGRRWRHRPGQCRQNKWRRPRRRRRVE